MGALIDSLKLSSTPAGSSGVIAPAPKATGYNPIQTAKTNINTGIRTTTAGLGAIGDILSRPLYGFGSGLQGAYQGAKDTKSISGWAKGGVTGAIKGLTGENKVTPGQYLTDTVLKNKIKSPFAKAGVQLATDIVADPLNVAAAPLAKAVGKGIGKVAKAVAPVTSKIAETARKIPAVYKPIEATINPYFRNPEAGKIIEATKTAIQGRVSNLYRLVDESVKGLTKSDQARVGQLLEGSISTAKTNPRLVEIANQFRKMAEDIGSEAVKTGLLSPESFAKYKGKYMTHIWLDMTGKSGDIVSEIPKITGEYFKKRKGAEGFVKEYAAPVFKGLGTEIKDIEAAKMYQNLGKTFAKTPKTAEELSQLAGKGYQFAEDISKSRGGEILNKSLLPKEIIEYVGRSKIGQKGMFSKVYDTAMNAWKAGKTVYNPAYHVRNMISNQILTDLQTGKGIIPTVVDYISSVKSYLGKGSQQYVNEARDAGLIKRVYFGEAVDNLLNTGFKKESILKKIAQAPSEFQQFSEETAKLNVFAEMRKQGLSVADAVKKAEEAIFSPYRISATERSIASKAIPFYSFTRQAAPFVAKTIATHPERVTKYIKAERAVNSLTKPEGEEYLPDYMKEMVRTPLKNKEGQPYYFNPQYIYPWGNFVSESKGMPLGLGLNPIYEEIKAQQTGIDPYYGTSFVRDSMSKDEQLKARINHAIRTLGPSLFNSVKDKIIPALQGKPDTQGRERNVPMTLTGELGGLKFYPFNQEKEKKNISTQKYIIAKDANSEIARIRRDLTLTSEEKNKKIQDIIKQKNERLQKLP